MKRKRANAVTMDALVEARVLEDVLVGGVQRDGRLHVDRVVAGVGQHLG